MVDEPKNEEGVQNATTPSSDAAITDKDSNQPDKTSTPDREAEYQKLLEEERQKAERYKQQLHGREKQVEELRAQVLAKKFFGSDEETHDTPDEKKEAPKVQPQRSNGDNLRDRMIVESRLREIQQDMTAKYGSDEDAPFDAATVRDRILELDPEGLALLNPKVWEFTYKSIKGEKLDDVRKRYTKEKKEIADKEDSKMVDAPSVPTNSGNSDALPFDKALKMMSTDELKVKYPKEYDAMLRRSLGL